ncbi:MAG: anaerobic ribonucleoside-triphosphate reductase [Candidatus Moranbacteria bacterium]|nr:anaerobic ribonucleoside-triphosphate reductase [Candidatus Moranbacteria bacterium]
MEKQKLICHDCKKELKKGDEYVNYTQDGEAYLIKCRECYEKDPVIKNFKECDVYSRVVGFHTPIGRWNKGKSAEWKDRKTFEIGEMKDDEKDSDDKDSCK